MRSRGHTQKIRITQVCIPGVVIDDTGDTHMQRVVIHYRLAEHAGGRDVAKIELGTAKRQHHRIRLIQGLRTARQPMMWEDVEIARPGKFRRLLPAVRNLIFKYFRFLSRLRYADPTLTTDERRGAGISGNSCLKRGKIVKWTVRKIHVATRHRSLGDDAVDPVPIRMVPIEAKLKIRDQK